MVDCVLWRKQSGAALLPSVAIATPSTADAMNDTGNISAMSDSEMSGYLDHYKSKEDRILQKEARPRSPVVRRAQMLLLTLIGIMSRGTRTMREREGRRGNANFSSSRRLGWSCCHVAQDQIPRWRA